MSDGTSPTLSPPSGATEKARSRFASLIPRSRLEMDFLCEAVKGLAGWLFSGSSTETVEGKEIPATFAGVCLALPKDAAATQAALDHVAELGVKSVRIDHSEAQDPSAFMPLLDGLKESGVGVLLHLVQPLRQAKQMPEPAALAAWERFVKASLETFSARIEAVEIGTTINRAKWAGYSLEGFIAAWEVAYPLVKESGHTLIGPNVTDFEPQYNSGVLGILKRRDLLPDIHSDNIFAERAIEPEAIDRKILGDTFKNLHGYDLVKKLRLLSTIARRNGVSRNWSTCAFWTLPRIERILASSEEQMADYLARYYIICASEGSFERFYWGPMVSGREGLLDDGTGLPEDRSIRDVVAYYRELPGESAQWRRRAAFRAFKTMHNLLSGACYHRRICGKKGLELHAFEKEEMQVHAVWTRNGKLARANEVYTEATLSAVISIRTRDGVILKSLPDHFSESPLYLSWESSTSVEVLPSAAIVPQAIVARPEMEYAYYSFRSDAWRGAVYARSRQDADQLIAALKPEVIGSPTAETTLRKARNAIWAIKDPLNAEQSLVVKKPIRVAWHKRILDRSKPSKSLRSWNGTSELQRRGIETPKVVAYFEHEDSTKVLDNWFICEHANTRTSVREIFNGYVIGKETIKGLTFEDFAKQLIEFVRNLHWKGVYFRDLAGGNILVRIGDDQRLVFSLIDTARARFSNQRFSRSKRIDDLKRLVHKLDLERQEYIMQAYLDRENASFTALHRLTFKLYSFKASLKRIKRKTRKRIS
jgi:tRNA A-37 threonylcarbamoyl transferase component Bud32